MDPTGGPQSGRLGAPQTRVQAIMDTVARVLVLVLTAVWGLLRLGE